MERAVPCVTDCERCPALVASRSRIVNGVGPTDAAVQFVGEAPGAAEDAQGEPFVGRSGAVLDETLRTVGLDREDVRISNCVRCRPPDNRDPHVDELANCRDYLTEEIVAVDPQLVVPLGKVPAEHLLDRDVAVTSQAGEVVEVVIGGRPRPVMICVHPAATLYDRSQESVFEDALAKAAKLVKADSGQSRLEDY
jgi:DNA polymerase